VGVFAGEDVGVFVGISVGELVGLTWVGELAARMAAALVK
jgi:hypothetical protein